MNLKLPPVVIEMLTQRGGVVDAGLRVTKARLLRACNDHDYPLHASVVAFEDAFGGLVIPDEERIKKGEPNWLFGAYACLTSGAHTGPRGGSKRRKLVPVVYSPNDIIYYLDESGKGYAEDTIEDSSASYYAGNGTSLVCRIIFDDALFSRKETSFDLPQLQGEVLSKRLSLALVKEASGTDRRFFSDSRGELLIVEDIKQKRTLVAAATKRQLDLAKPPVTIDSAQQSPEMIPYVGKKHVRMVSEQRTSLPEFLEHLQDMRELDVSINRLETLPESLWRATQLTHLYLGHNPLTALADGIGNLKSLTTLSLRRCPIKALPDALAGAKNLTTLVVAECEQLDVDAALLVIANLPKLKDLSLPLSRSLTSLTPLASLPLKSLLLDGAYVKHPIRLPSGLGQLKKLADLRIEYGDDIAQLPESREDITKLRLLFAKRFTDDDIRQAALKQPEKLYLKAFAARL